MNAKKLMIGGFIGAFIGIILGFLISSRMHQRDRNLNIEKSREDFVLRLTFAIPEADAEKAYKSGAKKYLGVGSPGIFAPGAPQATDINVINEYSDYVTSFAQERMNDLILAYAKKYNQRLTELGRNGS